MLCSLASQLQLAIEKGTLLEEDGDEIVAELAEMYRGCARHAEAKQ